MPPRRKPLLNSNPDRRDNENDVVAHFEFVLFPQFNPGSATVPVLEFRRRCPGGCPFVSLSSHRVFSWPEKVTELRSSSGILECDIDST